MAPNNAGGIPISLVGNLINSFGYLVWKFVHIQVEGKKKEVVNEGKADEKTERRLLFGDAIPRYHFLRHKMWYLGLLLYGFGSTLHGIALNMGSHTIIAPLDSITLVGNTLFAPIFLDEKLSKTQMIGTFFLAFGIACVAISAPSDGDRVGLEDFQSESCFDTYFTTAKCVASVSCWGGLVLIAYLSVLKKRKKDTKRNKSAINMLVVCFIAAFFGALCQMALKCMFGSFENIPDNLRDFKLYLITITFLVTNVIMEIWRQRALRDFDALYVVPIISAALLSGSVLFGGICFNEFDAMRTENGKSLGLGIFVCLMGVFGISLSNERQNVIQQAESGGQF